MSKSKAAHTGTSEEESLNVVIPPVSLLSLALLLVVVKTNTFTRCSVTHSFFDPMNWRVRQAPLSMGFPGKNTGVGCHALFQEFTRWVTKMLLTKIYIIQNC